jgi:hypothetical protein
MAALKTTRLLLAGATVAMTVASPAMAETTKTARFGQAMTLHGFRGEQMLVRPFRLQRLQPDEFDTVRAGRHLVGARLSLRNTGRSGYSDSPINSARLVTAGGRVLEPSISSTPACGVQGSLRVPRGQSRQTCLIFEVPNGARLRFFEFTLNSGFADETGQWRNLPTP